MQPEQLEQELKQGKLNSIYLLYGEEEYLKELCLKKIKKIFGKLLLGINYIQLDETNIEKLIPEIQTPAFSFEKKMILIKNSGLFKNAKTGTKKKPVKTDNLAENKIATYIEENLKVIKESVVLVFIESQVEKSILEKKIEKEGIVCNFETLKPAQIATRLKAICNAYKVKIDNSTLQVFIETCGTNMNALINEIRKLIEYTGENGEITKEAINLLSVKEFESIIFDLTDSLGKKDLKNALEILNELLYNKEPIQKILITLYNHFKKLYLTCLSESYNINCAESLNLKPNQIFLVNKYKMQAKYFNEDILKKILKQLIDLDYNYKQGNIDINVGLEAILCTYCG